LLSFRRYVRQSIRDTLHFKIKSLQLKELAQLCSHTCPPFPINAVYYIDVLFLKRTGVMETTETTETTEIAEAAQNYWQPSILAQPRRVALRCYYCSPEAPSVKISLVFQDAGNTPSEGAA
jgi:hypothetical protein